MDSTMRDGSFGCRAVSTRVPLMVLFFALADRMPETVSVKERSSLFRSVSFVPPVPRTLHEKLAIGTSKSQGSS